MRILVTLTLLLSSIISFSQTGTIRGVVLDSEDNEPLMGVRVFNKDKSAQVGSDFDGSYTLKLKSGEQYIYCTYVGYQDDSIKINLQPGAIISVNFKLRDKSLVSGITITGKAQTGGAVATIKDEINQGGTTTGMSRDDMKNQDVSNAANAASKASGVSVQGGKYVFVRGLSDRYSKTTVNGAEVPGLDPNRNSVQMDLFPANLIDKLTIYKSFTPDLPASFTGGLVDITTRDFPESFIVGASVKFGFNTQSAFNADFLGQETRGFGDNLGFDLLGRGIPTDVQRYGTTRLNNLYLDDNAKLDELGKSFSREFDPIKRRSLFNQSYTFSIGNQIDPSDSTKSYPKIGYIAGISYRKNYNHYDGGVQGRYSLVGDVETNNTLNPELDLEDTKSNEDALWGALGNVSVKLNPYNSVGIMTARFQNGVTSTRYLEGNNYNDAADQIFQTRTLMYQQRALTTAQLKGSHVLGKKDTANPKNNKDNVMFSWIASYTVSEQETPELKFFTNDYSIRDNGDTLYDIQPQLYSDPSQYYRYMNESNLDIKINFEKPIQTYRDSSGKGLKGKIKWGASYVDKYRVFSEKRYDFVLQSGNDLEYNGSVSDFMADEHFRAGDFVNGFIYLQDATEKRNSYIGSERTISGYAMADLYASQKLRIVAGARVEADTIFSLSKSPALRDSTGGYNQIDILPSFNGTYEIKKDTIQLRFAYTRTLARPTFRELAPFSSFDFVGGNVFVGNRNLQRTLIDNLDARLEFYPSPIQKFTVGAFMKNFTNPIERAFNPEAANAELTWRNVDEAIAYGAEIDFRLGLDSLIRTNKHTHMTVGGNFTYVFSEVQIPEKEMVVIQAQDPNAETTRQMFGQSPYIINGFFRYENDTLGIKANINFGVSGEKLSVVTVGATPNVYENARPNLGFNISKKLGEFDQFNIKFSALNLLNPEYKQTYTYKGTEYVFGSYTRGRTFNISLKYLFDKADQDEKKMARAIK